MNTESIANTKECNTDIDELMNDDKHQKVGNYSQVFGIGENCEFGEINVAKFHEICNNLQEQLTAAQELSSRYEKELSGERFYRKDLESKLMALSLETETKVGKCYETNKSVEERLELLATKQETDLRVMQVELNTARCKYKMISDNLLHLDRKYQKLLGLNREKASDMREKCIELPQGVDQLQFLALQLREELIETRAAYEHSVSELKNELIIAKEQLQDVENLLQESELRNSPFLASELQDSSVSTKVSDNDVRYQAIIAELEHKVISTQKERNNSELALAEMRRKCATLQNELDTCETVQKDFVRLSQQLQIQLEKLRQSEKEVRWQFDEDVSTCNTCDTLFNEKNTKSEKHHCRHCGKIFCGDCLVNIVNCGPNHREAHVCNVCYTLLNSFIYSMYQIIPQYGQDYGPPMDRGNPATLCNPDITLWMGDLKMEWDAEYIRNAFKHYAVEPANVKMVNDRYGAKTSFCFVEFHDTESARNAMLTLCGRPIPDDPDRGKFNLSFANSPNQSAEYNLFVTNLHHSVDDVALFRVFGERYASCRGARVYRHSDGSSREFGFVRFTNETDQQRALVEMNKHRLKSKEMVLKLAQPKDRRQRFSRTDRDGGGSHGSYEDRRSSRYDRRDDDRRRSGDRYGYNGVSGAAQPQFVAMAPNHGVAGYGTVPLQTYGAPAMVQSGVMPQYMVSAPVQFPGMAPMTMHYQNGAPMVSPDPRTLNPSGMVPSAILPVPVVQPPQVYVAGEQPLSAEEHNQLVMAMSNEFMTTLESSRWNRVSIPMSTRPKELTTILYNV